MLAAGYAQRALVVGGDILSKRRSTGPTARRSSSSATAPARSCSSGVERGGFLGFELGADGGGASKLLLPGSGSRRFEDAGPLPDE